MEKEKNKRMRKFDGSEYDNALEQLQKKNKKLIRKAKKKLADLEDQEGPTADKYRA